MLAGISFQKEIGLFVKRCCKWTTEKEKNNCLAGTQSDCVTLVCHGKPGQKNSTKFHPMQTLTGWWGQKVGCLHDTSTDGEGDFRGKVPGSNRKDDKHIEEGASTTLLCYHARSIVRCFHMNGDPPRNSVKEKLEVLILFYLKYYLKPTYFYWYTLRQIFT